MNDLHVVVSIENRQCFYCKKTGKVYCNFDTETYEDDSFELCKSCYHKKPKCIDCGSKIYEEDTVCSNIHPIEQSIKIRCNDCEDRYRRTLCCKCSPIETHEDWMKKCLPINEQE